ncbi:MAG: heterodisulfide reductase subunit A-like protein [Halanaerobium sp.]
MSKKGLLLCVCQGNCPSFEGLDEYEALNRLRRDKLIDWVGIHPQLCSKDGDKYLIELLKGSDVDELYVGGCDPVMQEKMFRDAFEKAGFDQDKFKAVEIRNLNTDEVEEKLREAIGA